MRTIIDIPEQDRRRLDELCQTEAISRAEAVRQAVAEYLRHRQPPAGADVFGLWRVRGEDALTYEDRVRTEWDPAP